MVQWLRLGASTAGAQVQSLAGELEILKAVRHGPKKKKFSMVRDGLVHTRCSINS